MEIKGVSVRVASEFVRKRFASRYDEWLGSLSQASQEMVTRVLPASWYPLREGLIEPTEKICELFFGGSEDGAWEVGRTSADMALRGIYRVFVRFGSPEFILKRASVVFVNMLRPGEIRVVKSTPNSAVLHMHLPQSDRMLELRMAGWMQQALVISGCSQPKIRINSSIVSGATLTEFSASWG